MKALKLAGALVIAGCVTAVAAVALAWHAHIDWDDPWEDSDG